MSNKGSTYLPTAFEKKGREADEVIRQVLGQAEHEVFVPFAQNCAGCKKSIPAKTSAVRAGGKVFHKECFNCSNCQKSCLTGSFTVLPDAKLVCQLCGTKFEKMASEKPYEPTDTCYKCKKPVSKGQKLGERTYHRECLVCGVCNKSFTSGKIALLNGDPVHDECRGKASSAPKSTLVAPTVQGGKGGVNDLQRLKELHSKGLLTDEEFAQTKKAIGF
ncbi:LIM domain protein [Acrasis kona]|uniref:LIM domain protein n=1 Tax=Acrasis kona TaxID=1008807 RepID=A0AAW2Z3Y4_9EUKA